MTPRKIVAELDRFIVGQHNAKRAVAIALRNRWRRQQVPEDLRDEIAPKNIIMIGPTGVGKTEISRRLAKLSQAPFLKVEASKFTEVGYVGRDVESMIRDLLDVGIAMVKAERIEGVREAVEGSVTPPGHAVPSRAVTHASTVPKRSVPCSAAAATAGTSSSNQVSLLAEKYGSSGRPVSDRIASPRPAPRTRSTIGSLRRQPHTIAGASA